jgi:hypothetical protein
MAIGALAEHLWKIAFIGIGYLVLAFSNWTTDMALAREDAKEFLRAMLDNCTKTLEAARPVASQGTLRANVMIVDEDTDSLVIALHTGAYGPAELGLRWH